MRLRSRSRSFSPRAALRSRSFTYLSRYGSRFTRYRPRPTLPLAAPIPRRHRNRHVVDWLLRREPQVLHIFRGIVFDRLDPFLVGHFARHRRGARVAHQAVAETLAYVEEKVVAFLFRVLRFFLRTHQLRNRVHHVAA